MLALLGPWPVDNRPYLGTWYDAATRDRLGRIAQPLPAPAVIRVGAGQADITPAKPVPLAGFSNQAGKVFGSVDTRCFARALTVSTGQRRATIVTADLLLINAEVAAMVSREAQVPPAELFFTASHTHGGPGAWGRHPLEGIVAGRFDADHQRWLAGQIAASVRQSRANLVPAEVALVVTETKGRQKNRVIPEAPTWDALSALVFRPAGAKDGASPLAILTSFGAHATIVRADPPRLSADYPGAFVERVRNKTDAGIVLFAAGAVGDAAPVRPDIPSPPRAAVALGHLLADDLLAALPTARFAAEAVVEQVTLPVDLPPVRLAFFSAWLRFSPAATWWIADRRTHLDALRIGPAVLLGFPGDEAGHLARAVVTEGRFGGVTPVVTSFNGDYRGYFESSDVFLNRSCYETRWMNFYGPWLGEYLGSLATLMARMTGGAPLPDSPGIQDLDLGRKAMTLVVLAIGLGSTAVSRGQGRRVRSRFAWVVAGGFGIASILVPRWVDWASFDLGADFPALVGLIWVVIGPIRARIEKRPLAGLNPGWFVALALVSESWPVILAGLWWMTSGPGKLLTDPISLTEHAVDDPDHQSK